MAEGVGCEWWKRQGGEGGERRREMLFKDENSHLSVSVKCKQMIVDAGTKHGNRRNKDRSRKTGIISS